MGDRLIPSCIAAVLFSQVSTAAGGIVPGSLLVVDRGTNALIAVDPVSGGQTIVSAGGLFAKLESVTVSANGEIYVVDGDRFGPNGSLIIRVDSDTGAQTIVAEGGNFLDLHDAVFDAGGDLLAADFSGPSGFGGIIRVDPANGQQTVVFTGMPTPFDLAVEASGDVLAVRRNAFGSLLFRVDPVMGTWNLLALDVGLAEDIAIASDGDIFVADAGAFGAQSSVIQVDPVSGDTMTVSSDQLFGFLTGLAFDESDVLYVTDIDEIFRLDVLTGVPELVSSGGFMALSGIAVFPIPGAPLGPDLDIKPGSCPNSYNRNSHGVLPVALVGTAGFDVTEVDLDSLRLRRKDGGGGEVAPNFGPPGPHPTIEDVARPFTGEEQCDCHEETGDGIDDLMMHFRTDDVVANLDLNSFDPGALVSLTLTGTLNDGTPFEVDDCVRLVPPGTPPGMLAVGSNVTDVWIDLSPIDNQLDGGGFATFVRSFPLSSVVTLKAPKTQNGSSFEGWKVTSIALQSQGAAGPVLDVLSAEELIPGKKLVLTIDSALLVEAIYAPPPNVGTTSQPGKGS